MIEKFQLKGGISELEFGYTTLYAIPLNRIQRLLLFELLHPRALFFKKDIFKIN